MSELRAGKPRCWVSWITGLLSGDDHCQFSAWFKSRYKYTKYISPTTEPFDSITYNAAHDSLTNVRVAQLRDAGFVVREESENDFTVYGQNVIIAGKPDIVAFADDHIRIVDSKSGKPRKEHWWQVAVYMRFVRKVLGATADNKIIEGEIYYGDRIDGTVAIPHTQLTATITNRINQQLIQIGFDMPPHKSPSPRECRFCNVPPEDCSERATVSGEASTTDF